MEHSDETRYPPQHEGNAFVLLLEDRRAFADFAAAFVEPSARTPQLDFEHATLDRRVYVSETLREGAHDVLWRIPRADGDLYVFMLVEHQSRIDHAMPLRVLFYMNAVWHKLYCAANADRRKTSSFRVPPILPIVLYTGEEPWASAIRLAEVIDSRGEFEGLLPDFRLRILNFRQFTDTDFGVPGNFACALLHVVWALMKGLPGAEFARVFEGLRPFWGIQELELLGAVLYHYACAEGRRDMAERLHEMLRPKEVLMSKPEAVRKRFWEVWADEGRIEGEAKGRAEGKAEGETSKERQLLREQVDAIRAFFARKGLAWEPYAESIEALPSHREATDFLVDLATATDMFAFLKERFGH